MSVLESIRKQSSVKKHILIASISGFLLLIIICVGIFWYEAPYKKSFRREYTLHKKTPFQDMFSNATRDAEAFVSPVEDFFTQQNIENSSEF